MTGYRRVAYARARESARQEQKGADSRQAVKSSGGIGGARSVVGRLSS
jgi:hypothetical protein